MSLTEKSASFSVLDPPLQQALVCDGSLTRHLETTTGKPLRVRLERQTLRPSWQENLVLWQGLPQLPVGKEILVREAWLSIARKDLIFAHSEMLLDGLAQVVRSAVEQGEEPLGMVFQERDGEVSRQHLELARVRAPELALRAGMLPHHPFWCRRSLFLTGSVMRARILEMFLAWP
ncbi:MAG: chorismate lyase [Magnetococcales bacterium]|nr:chorismate lyase [Magnetococcales bacterium]MBF0321638.1 chorismate lyase [Magnetococcales bacterium]